MRIAMKNGFPCNFFKNILLRLCRERHRSQAVLSYNYNFVLRLMFTHLAYPDVTLIMINEWSWWANKKSSFRDVSFNMCFSISTHRPGKASQDGAKSLNIFQSRFYGTFFFFIFLKRKIFLLIFHKKGFCPLPLVTMPTSEHYLVILYL